MEFIGAEKAAAMIGITVEELYQMRLDGTGPKFFVPNGVMVRRMAKRAGKPVPASYAVEDVRAWIAERDASLTT